MFNENQRNIEATKSMFFSSFNKIFFEVTSFGPFDKTSSDMEKIKKISPILIENIITNKFAQNIENLPGISI